MRFALAWQILSYDKGRTALAIAGVFMAILLVFVQLGFFIAVPQGGLLLYDRMDFSLLIASSGYQYQAQPGQFARSRLDRARQIVGVAQVAGVDFGSAKWLGGEDGKAPDVFVIGFDPRLGVFAVDDINRQRDVLEEADRFLVDTATRPMFGPLTTGRTVTIDNRLMMIGGHYVLGTGFMGLGVILVGDPNFARLFPYRDPGQVNLGLVQLKPGADPHDVADALRRALGPDIRVFTRPELELA